MMVKSIVPLLVSVHVTSVEVETKESAGMVSTAKVLFALQPILSVTVMVYEPIANPEMS